MMRRNPVVVVTLALLAMGLAIPLVLGMPEAGGLGTFAVFTLWCNGPWSPLLPALYEPVLLATGRTHGAMPVALVGTAGTVLVEWANYHVHAAAIGSERLSGVREHRATTWLSQRFARRPFFYVWLCAWSPLPYWPVRTLSPLAGLSVPLHLLATGIGRLPRLWFIAAVGAFFQPPLWVLVLICMAPVVIAGVVWVRGRRAKRAGEQGVRDRTGEQGVANRAEVNGAVGTDAVAAAVRR